MQVSFVNFRQSLPRTIWDWLILSFSCYPRCFSDADLCDGRDRA